MSSSKPIQDFERLHGQSKILDLEKQLATEREKVATLADARRSRISIKADGGSVKFAVIGDTHIGSLYANADGLSAFYQLCAERGVQSVVHAGDVTDGWAMYKGQEFEVDAVGFDAQLERVISQYPKIDGLTTYFITGNHDLSFKKLAGVKMGKAISDARPDMIQMGEGTGRMAFDFSGGRKYEVLAMHPAGGCAYAVSYKPQKIVESFEGGVKPSMLILGHFHKAEFIPSYRNVACLQAGTFQWQTPFMESIPTPAHVGGWIVEVTAGDKWNLVTASFLACYR